MLQRIDGHFLRGYGDRAEEADITIDPDAAVEAARFLEEMPDTADRLEDVRTLIDGFESPWGLELLTTVHWAAYHGNLATAEDVTDYVANWNPRKRRTFDARHVDAAWQQLDAYDWLPELDPVVDRS